MRNKKAETPESKSKLASFLKGFISFMLVLLIVAGIIIFIFSIQHIINPDMEYYNTFRHFNLLYKLTPVTIDKTYLDFQTNANLPITDNEVQLLAAFKFKFTSRWTILIIYLSIYLVLGLVLLMLLQLRKFLKSVEQGNPFTHENANRIRVVGWTIILISVLGFLGINGFAIYFKQPLLFNNYELSFYPFLFRDMAEKVIWEIFLGLIIVMIAEIFRLGSKMKEEQELTI